MNVQGLLAADRYPGYQVHNFVTGGLRGGFCPSMRSPTRKKMGSDSEHASLSLFASFDLAPPLLEELRRSCPNKLWQMRVDVSYA
jgi:hypothetical protein